MINQKMLMIGRQIDCGEIVDDKVGATLFGQLQAKSMMHVGDDIYLLIWGNSKEYATYKIDPDGTINYPPVDTFTYVPADLTFGTGSGVVVSSNETGYVVAVNMIGTVSLGSTKIVTFGIDSTGGNISIIDERGWNLEYATYSSPNSIAKMHTDVFVCLNNGRCITVNIDSDGIISDVLDSTYIQGSLFNWTSGPEILQSSVVDSDIIFMSYKYDFEGHIDTWEVDSGGQFTFIDRVSFLNPTTAAFIGMMGGENANFQGIAYSTSTSQVATVKSLGVSFTGHFDSTSEIDSILIGSENAWNPRIASISGKGVLVHWQYDQSPSSYSLINTFYLRDDGTFSDIIDGQTTIWQPMQTNFWNIKPMRINNSSGVYVIGFNLDSPYNAYLQAYKIHSICS